MRSQTRYTAFFLAAASLVAFTDSCTQDVPKPTGIAATGGATQVNGGAGPSAGGMMQQGTAGAGPGAGGAAAMGGAGPGVVVTGGAMPVEKRSCADKPYTDKYMPGYTAPADPQVEQVLASMDDAAKFAQMQGTDKGSVDAKNWHDIQRSPDDTVNNIRGYMYRDGPRGLNLDARQEGREYLSNFATAFPVTMARAASWDLELEYLVGRAQGDETVASQNTMLLGPCMNILRHPAWGRAQETYGEDVFHIGRMASAYTAGLQTFVAGCAKHFAGNNIEDQRENLNAEMDEQTLREIYGRHFEMVVREGGVACIMAAYNSINGTKSTQNKHLLTDVLRTDFGFRGFVLSDWWAMPPGKDFPEASAAQTNAVGAVEAGLDVEVPWTMNYAQLQSVVSAGRLSMAQINASVSRILEQKFRFKSARIDQPIGLETPTTSMDKGSIIGNDHHIELAKTTALKSMVLVKNDAGTLPIKTDGSVKTIAVLGAKVPYNLISTTPASGVIDFAVDQPLGDRGSSRVNADPAKTTGPTAGLAAAGARHSVTVKSGNTAAEAAGADFVVVMVGLTPQNEGEEYQSPDNGDRSSFALGAGQDELVTAVAALGIPMVVVIEAGSSVDMPWLASVPAVVHAWYPGQRGGLALGELLFGEANFSGKMPFTWPNSWEELPTFNEGTTTKMDYYLGYRYYDVKGITPLFPFGHGLSYTTFEYSNLQVPCADVTKGGLVEVTVDVKNTGTVAGEEVVMLFASYPETKATRRSMKELKGFVKVKLEPGITKRVPIPVRVSDLKYWDMPTSSWVIESGAVQFSVGPNAATLPLTDTVTVQ